ncbi:HEAT repeat domain-containing protein [Cryptosporangium arvum]|uniref:Uncharacterized protein n=1 Tax=Cryptosporangium arvum DSM 44712 TaxID=927661 RepID=A0A011AGM8_9ACTN|nr:hypothetical protein [Cryptosporangium arvum]EXG81161.1 hypothetical protein CryarDRAFT_2268 [Cryptosporangium arvum DSM 44712]
MTDVGRQELDRAVHQGSLSTEAGPLVARIVEVLPVVPERTALLEFLGHVAARASSFQADPLTVDYVRRDDPELPFYEVVWEPDHAPDHVVVSRLGSACAARAGVVLPALVPWLDAADPHERRAALYATASWAALAGGGVPDQALHHLWTGARDHGAEARVHCVLGLAGAGADTAELLTDPSRVVRACAALSPAVATDPRTLPVLTAALADPADCDSWIDGHPAPPHAGDEMSALLVEAATRCTDDFAELLPIALSVGRASPACSPDRTWGRLLHAAFPQPPAEPLRGPQRAYLQVLAANDYFWQISDVERDAVLGEVGLPTDREALRRY